MIKLSLIKRFLFYLSIFIFCSCKNVQSDSKIAEMIKIGTISDEMEKVRDYVYQNAVIAHRGSTYWVPEETEVAFRWARQIGADYLEIDLQRTKDGVLLALHDDNLQRTSNIEEVLPDKQNSHVHDLTYEEIMKLDAGSWFNDSSPNQGRRSFVGQYISTLEDVIRIAEGKRIVRNADGTRKYTKDVTTGKYTFFYEPDPVDNGNRPGVYLETKEPKMFPGIEKDIYEELDRLGWNIVTNPQTDTEHFKNGKVNTGNTNGRIVLQTFSSNSLVEIEKHFQGKVPTCYLLWVNSEFIKKGAPSEYATAIDFTVAHKAHFIGPSIGGVPNNYHDLLLLWQAEMAHRAKLKVHAYSFDTQEQMDKYYGLEDGKQKNEPLTDGMFTNRSEMTIDFYKAQKVRPDNISGNDKHPEEILDELGYTK